MECLIKINHSSFGSFGDLAKLHEYKSKHFCDVKSLHEDNSKSFWAVNSDNYDDLFDEVKKLKESAPDYFEFEVFEIKKVNI